MIRVTPMSQRFIRCPHCHFPHDSRERICPETGLSIPEGAGDNVKAVAHSAPPKALRVDPPHKGLDLIGKTIGGRYVLKGALGSGGMGTVFEGEHIGLGRPVAIKVLNPAQAKKAVAVQRFQQEARTAGAIGHPNICEVYDLGSLDDKSPYLVMEKLEGVTLSSRIQGREGLPPAECIDILLQVLAGLSAAHDKGIVHRDIKPENIFLAQRLGATASIAKILDFGVSKVVNPSGVLGDDLNLTRTGMVMGTPYYMSPEQARGDRNLDARVDLYACGVMLYEMLTGKRPFIAPNYNALLLQIIHKEPRPLRAVRASIPEGFDSIVDRAMKKDRVARYQTAQDFIRELNALGRKLSPRRTGDLSANAPLAVRAPPPLPKMMTPNGPIKPATGGPSGIPPIPQFVLPSPGGSLSVPPRTPAAADSSTRAEVRSRPKRVDIGRPRVDHEDETKTQLQSRPKPPLPRRSGYDPEADTLIKGREELEDLTTGKTNVMVKKPVDR